MSPRYFSRIKENIVRDQYLFDNVDSDAGMWTAFAFLVGIKPASKKGIAKNTDSKIHDDLIARNTEGNRSKYE